MYPLLITFSSPTAAEKALRLFRFRGYRAEMLRIPLHLAEEGCVTGVNVHFENRNEVRRLLEKNGIPYRAVIRSEREENA